MSNVIYLGEKTLKREGLFQNAISFLICNYIKSNIEFKMARIRQKEMIKSIIFRKPFDWEKVINYRHKITTEEWEKIYRIQCAIRRIKGKINSIISRICDFLYEETEEAQITIEEIENKNKGKIIPINAAIKNKSKRWR